jgi:hypothetical protein
MNTKFVFQHKTSQTDYDKPEYVVCTEVFSFMDFILDTIPQFKKSVTSVDTEKGDNASEMRYYIKEHGLRTGEAYKLLSSEPTNIDIS